MSQIFLQGLGAVSPAGWGLDSLRKGLDLESKIPIRELSRPGSPETMRVRRVPHLASRPIFMSHPRLRRSSPITQYAAAAALEALGQDIVLVHNRTIRLGLVFCVMSGCVNYSCRLYGEILQDPTTASPLIFPETVFNAPSSHLAALLGTAAVNYTLVGDPGVFLQGVAFAAHLLQSSSLEACLVVGAEEVDWFTSDAFHLYSRKTILSEGAGVLYLTRSASRSGAVELRGVTQPYLFSDQPSRLAASQAVRRELPPGSKGELLCDSQQGITRFDRAEAQVWKDWPGHRLSPKTILGEGLMAAAAWQCVVAADALKSGSAPSAHISVVGCNHQAVGAQLLRH